MKDTSGKPDAPLTDLKEERRYAPQTMLTFFYKVSWRYAPFIWVDATQSEMKNTTIQHSFLSGAQVRAMKANSILELYSKQYFNNMPLI